jgi:hypothetical protein
MDAHVQLPLSNKINLFYVSLKLMYSTAATWTATATQQIIPHSNRFKLLLE